MTREDKSEKAHGKAKSEADNLGLIYSCKRRGKIEEGERHLETRPHLARRAWGHRWQHSRVASVVGVSEIYLFPS